MNSTGIQNYLSNVFRPICVYDPITNLYTPKLELSNVDTYSGNSISVFTAAISDANSNVYVGSNAGNPYNILKATSNVTAVGYGAGSNISNVCNSVYVGWYSGANAQNARDVVAIGANTIGNGVTNIFMGTSTGTAGNSNILIGHYITPGVISNQIRIGLRNQIPIAADVCLNWVGFNGILAPRVTTNRFDVSGDAQFDGHVGINMAPTKTLDVDGDIRVDNGRGNLIYSQRAVGTESNASYFLVNDNFGTMTFSHDAPDISGNANTVLGISNANTIKTSIIDISGSVKASEGFYSVRGATLIDDTSNVSIATLKKGLVMISVWGAAGTEFDGRTEFVLDTTTPTVGNLSSNKSANTTVNFTTNSINISNTVGATVNYSWTVTYFPLP